ncbi:MAG: DUF4097 family beta strand repeat protein [Candidatus Cloacimonetes bacterium]|jgi:DUF4097 and DUF4098 domain-containing protein YvlB|nr:DUF4097 family beta strand repeat protein [Candidatus Cloacimonadota bacterium]
MLELLMASALLLAGAPQRIDTIFPADGLNVLVVENRNGATIVRGWDREQVRIRAASRPQDRIDVDVDRTDGMIRVETERGREVQYEIDVPVRMAVDVEGTNQSVRIDNVMAPISVESVNGEVSVRGGRQSIRLETVQGRITLENAAGTIDISSTNNTVRVRRSSGVIMVETVNGSITLEEVRATELEASTVNGSVLYNGTLDPAGTYTVSTHNGTIDMRVPQGTDATFVVSTFNGEFEVDFPIQVRDQETRGQYQFRLGSGAARVELESFSGNVRVLRARQGSGGQ